MNKSEYLEKCLLRKCYIHLGAQHYDCVNFFCSIERCTRKKTWRRVNRFKDKDICLCFEAKDISVFTNTGKKSK